jgi:hypothetical protein
MATEQPAPALADDLIEGVRGMALEVYGRDDPNTARKIYHHIEMADRAAAAGEVDDGSWFPFVRRRGTVYSRRSWLQRWFAGEAVPVPPGARQRTTGRGRPRKGAAPPEPVPATNGHSAAICAIPGCPAPTVVRPPGKPGRQPSYCSEHLDRNARRRAKLEAKP